MQRQSKFFVYILRCRDGSFYTGYTSNLTLRIKQHNAGQGARYLKIRIPVSLVFVKTYRYYKNALTAERRIKKLTRAQKENLIQNYVQGKIR